MQRGICCWFLFPWVLLLAQVRVSSCTATKTASSVGDAKSLRSLHLQLEDNLIHFAGIGIKQKMRGPIGNDETSSLFGNPINQCPETPTPPAPADDAVSCSLSQSEGLQGHSNLGLMGGSLLLPAYPWWLKAAAVLALCTFAGLVLYVRKLRHRLRQALEKTRSASSSVSHGAPSTSSLGVEENRSLTSLPNGLVGCGGRERAEDRAWGEEHDGPTPEKAEGADNLRNAMSSSQGGQSEKKPNDQQQAENSTPAEFSEKATSPAAAAKTPTSDNESFTVASTLPAKATTTGALIVNSNFSAQQHLANVLSALPRAGSPPTRSKSDSSLFTLAVEALQSNIPTKKASQAVQQQQQYQRQLQQQEQQQQQQYRATEISPKKASRSFLYTPQLSSSRQDALKAQSVTLLSLLDSGQPSLRQPQQQQQHHQEPQHVAFQRPRVAPLSIPSNFGSISIVSIVPTPTPPQNLSPSKALFPSTSSLSPSSPNASFSNHQNRHILSGGQGPLPIQGFNIDGTHNSHIIHRHNSHNSNLSPMLISSSPSVPSSVLLAPLNLDTAAVPALPLSGRHSHSSYSQFSLTEPDAVQRGFVSNNFPLSSDSNTPSPSQLPSADGDGLPLIHTSSVQPSSLPAPSLVPSTTPTPSNPLIRMLSQSRFTADFETSLPSSLATIAESETDLGHRHTSPQLGKGGFGTVIRAKNRLDEREYAIKQIILWTNETRINERILREVKSLACLDHPNIVRYYQSWIEEVRDEEQLKLLSSEEAGELSWSETASESSSSSEAERDEFDRKSFLDDSFDNVINKRSNGNKAADIESYSLPRPYSRMHLSALLNGLEEVADDQGDKDYVKSGNKEMRVRRRMKQISLATSPSGKIHSNHDKEKFNATKSVMVSKGEPYCLYIQMQYCSQGTLQDWLEARAKSKACADPRVNLHLFKQLVAGMAHVHAMGLIHRDLKPANIFMTSPSDIRIGDFGLSTNLTSSFSRNNSSRYSRSSSNPDKAEESPSLNSSFVSQGHTRGIGTPLYCSPEQLNGKSYSLKSDIFSMGIIFCELCYVFQTQMERQLVLTACRKGNIPLPPSTVQRSASSTTTLSPLDISLPPHSPCKAEIVQCPSETCMSNAARNYVLKLLAPKPIDRPDASEVLRHSYVAGLSYPAESDANHSVSSLPSSLGAHRKQTM